jgi:hypothetical protein
MSAERKEMFTDRNKTPDLRSLEAAAKELSKPMAKPILVDDGESDGSKTSAFRAMQRANSVANMTNKLHAPPVAKAINNL